MNWRITKILTNFKLLHDLIFYVLIIINNQNTMKILKILKINQNLYRKIAYLQKCQIKSYNP